MLNLPRLLFFFINSLIQHLLSSCYVPDTVPGTKESIVHKETVIIFMTGRARKGRYTGTSKLRVHKRHHKWGGGQQNQVRGALRHVWVAQDHLRVREGFHEEVVLKPRSKGHIGILDKYRRRGGRQMVFQAEQIYQRSEVGKNRKLWKDHEGGLCKWTAECRKGLHSTRGVSEREAWTRPHGAQTISPLSSVKDLRLYVRNNGGEGGYKLG